MLRRHLFLGTALLPLGMSAHAQLVPMRKARLRNGFWTIDLSLTEKTTTPDGTVSLVAETAIGAETVGLAVDIGPDWKVVDPRMHVLSFGGEVRLRSLGQRSDALVAFVAKAHGLAANPMATERRLQMISTFPPSPDAVLEARARIDSEKGIWLGIDWPHRHFFISTSDVQRLLDVLTRAA